MIEGYLRWLEGRHVRLRYLASPLYCKTQIGVRGYCEPGWGVAGESEAGLGVRGVCESGTGVFGSSQTGVGVHGKGGRLAGFFEGDVEVKGDIRVGSEVRMQCSSAAAVWTISPWRRFRPHHARRRFRLTIL
jgi:hypothetical protein